MKHEELQVLGALFEKANNMMANRGCNDVDSYIIKLMTKEQWTELFKEMHADDEDPEPYAGENYLGCNWWVLSHLFNKLLKESGNK